MTPLECFVCIALSVQCVALSIAARALLRALQGVRRQLIREELENALKCPPADFDPSLYVTPVGLHHA